MHGEKIAEKRHECSRCPHICGACGKEVEIEPGTFNSMGRDYIARPVFCRDSTYYSHPKKLSCRTESIRRGWERRGGSVEFGTATYDVMGRLLGIREGEQDFRFKVPHGQHEATVIVSATFANGKTYRFDGGS